MPRASRTRDLLGPILLALPLLALPAVPAHAADATSILTLPGDSYAALVVDLDGDGSRDLLRIRDTAAGASLEAWGAPAGAWTLTATVPIVRAEANGHLVPLTPTIDPAVILATRQAGHLRPLLITGGVTSSGTGCCVSGWWIDVAGASLRLTAAPGLPQGFDQEYLLDTDADGTDELLVFDVNDEGTRTVISLFRQAGDRWTAAGPQISMAEALGGGVIGESDGEPGEEMVMSIESNQRMWRIGSDVDGRQRVDSARAPGADDPSFAVWPSIVTEGQVVTTTGTTLTTMRWPRGGLPEVLHTRHDEDGGWLTTVGTGQASSTRAILVGNDPVDQWGATVRILDANLRTVADFGTIRSPMEAIMSLEASNQIHGDLPYPWSGPLPGGLPDGRAAYIVNGTLFSTDASGEPSMEPVGAFAGANPIGLAGSDGDWMVMADQWYGAGRDGGLGTQAPSRTWIVPAAAVLHPGDADRPMIGRPAGTMPLPFGRVGMRSDGFDVEVSAPPESRVFLAIGSRVRLDGTLPGGISTLRVAPDRLAAGNQRFSASLLITTPLGLVAGATWNAEILREPPIMTVSAATDTFTFGATLVGSVSRGATVTVDGAPVDVKPDGTFRTRLEAGPWPRDVRVGAVDVVGNETVASLSVVGFLDYRWVPWPLLVILATSLAGVALYVYAPRFRRPVEETVGELGRLEDLDPTEDLARTWAAAARRRGGEPDERPPG